MAGQTQRKSKDLTLSAFDALLAALDPDRGTAADKYELLRQRLVKFFECRSHADPDERADASLDRIARNLEAGETIRNLNAYALGVARLVSLESKRGEARGGAAIREVIRISGDEPAANRMTHCLERCLANLSTEERRLLVQYYEGEGMARINSRQELAAKLNIAQNTLRIRVHRLRAGVEDCARRCIEDTRP